MLLKVFYTTLGMTIVRVLATADATEPKDSSSHVAACSSDVYSTLKLNVTIDGIKLELLTGDSDLVSMTLINVT